MNTRKLHLSLLMFFQVSVPGAFIPIMSLYLKDYLGFSSMQIGVILSIPSIPSLVIPILSLFIVDKLITARKFMMLCHLLSAIVISTLAASSGYIAVLVLFSIYMATIVPTYGLINTLIFANMEKNNSYTFIRLWGTVGWMISGLLVSLIWKYTKSPDNMPLALIIAAILSLVVIVLTFKLPKMHLGDKKIKKEKSSNSFVSILKPKVILMFSIILVISIADKYYFYGAPIFLQDIGIKKENIMMLMAIAQIPEIIMLFFFKQFIKKVGFKMAFIISLILLTVRFVLFYIGDSVLLPVIGITAGGFVYAILFSGVLVYLDNETDEKSRSNIHQLYNFITIGICGLAGNFLAGLTADTFKIGGNIDFKIFWGVPSLLTIFSLILLSLLMKKDRVKIDNSSIKKKTA